MRGRVASGQGDLAQWMRRYADAYECINPKLGWKPRRWAWGVGLVPCRLNDQPCWVVRTDRNNAGTGHHPLTVLEVVSTVHLRSTLGLHDGDEVHLEVGR